MSINPDRTVTLDGREFTLRLGLRGITAVEELLEVEIGNLSAVVKSPTKRMQYMLWACLMHHHPMSLDDVGELIDRLIASNRAEEIGAALGPILTKERGEPVRPPSAAKGGRRQTGAISSSRGAKRG